MNFPGATFDPATQPAATSGGYVYALDRIVLAVNVALATTRPLLVTGLPGSGKSTLARAVAQELGWAYVSSVITSRTRAEDLISDVDLVRRLSDAQTPGTLQPDEAYLVPGPLWWAVSPATAHRRLRPGAESPVADPGRHTTGVVILLDEIDKAEPDLPNDLLAPLDGLRLTLPFVGPVSPEFPVLTIITSNGERDMPPAFLRRCVTLDLREQDQDFLVRVAESHFGERKDDLYPKVALHLLLAQKEARRQNRRVPSTAEFLDTVRACIAFQQTPGSPGEKGSELWQAIEEAALSKPAAGG